ncbi:MAG TPA: hypothetical protein VGY32_11475 [Solirubrobacteraceae bacterium]|jgi:hypothetical protein|nr:hypothetical protein [Solirubrobacteraceae bacterium]
MIDSQPEKVLSRSVTRESIILPTQSRVMRSPEWEAYCLVSASDPADQAWEPEWEEVSRLLHALPDTATRVSIVFERHG